MPPTTLNSEEPDWLKVVLLVLREVGVCLWREKRPFWEHFARLRRCIVALSLVRCCIMGPQPCLWAGI